MDTPNSQLQTLLELEARHDDLLQRLHELDKQVERVLAECLSGPGRKHTEGGPVGEARVEPTFPSRP